MWTKDKPKAEGWYWYKDDDQAKPLCQWVTARTLVKESSRWLIKPICVTCTHAVWARDKAGRLHVNGEGMCKAPLPATPQLPKAYYWIKPPEPAGGLLNRKEIRFAECDFFHDVTWEQDKTND